MTAFETAQAFFTALDQHEWARAVGYFEDSFAERLRRQELARLLGIAVRLQELGLREHTEGFLGYNPVYSPELVAAFGDRPVYNLPGATTITGLATLAAPAFLEAYLSRSSRWRPFVEADIDAIVVREIITEEPVGASDQVLVRYRFALSSHLPPWPQPEEHLFFRRASAAWSIVYDEARPGYQFLRFMDLANPDSVNPAG